MALTSAALLAALLASAGCGENVLVGNWQLRSLSDAGIELPEEADAAANPRGAAAQAARNKQKLKNGQKDRQSHSNGDEDSEH